MPRNTVLAVLILLLCIASTLAHGAASNAARGVVSTRSIQGKVMCGYQGWFRCPGDPSGLGWVHWSRETGRIAPDTLSFEMWPDLTEFPAKERYPAPGFTYPDGRQAELFSSEGPGVTLRHFEWMRTYGIAGVWLQHFLVDLPGGPVAERYGSRMRVLANVRAAANRTGRVWALSYDIAGMPTDRIYDVLTADWKRMVDTRVVHDPRYLHQDRLPALQIWGFYYRNGGNRMTAELANRLIDFFAAPGKYRAFLLGGGDWNWRANPDPEWRKIYARFGAYSPWNVGNYSVDATGVKHASVNTWADGKREMERAGKIWLPVIYPGFSWDNLTRQPAGKSEIARRGGHFLWEQFEALAKLHVDTVYVAMFDEVDEGTAIFKVTSAPPTQAHFVGFDGLPSDWYLRLVGEGARGLVRGSLPPFPPRPVTADGAGHRNHRSQSDAGGTTLPPIDTMFAAAAERCRTPVGEPQTSCKRKESRAGR